MGCNKVVVNGQTLVDLTADTVDAAHLVEGYTAHSKTGEGVTGSIPVRNGSNATASTATTFTIKAGYYPNDIQVKYDENYIWNDVQFETDLLMAGRVVKS